MITSKLIPVKSSGDEKVRVYMEVQLVNIGQQLTSGVHGGSTGAFENFFARKFFCARNFLR
jgi:hypothetical protein